jgi:hypothetical protein
MLPTQVRGSTLVATLAAVLLAWCAIEAPASICTHCGYQERAWS